MKLPEAITVFAKYWPCSHDNSYTTNLGDGKTWANCDDCGATFLLENLDRRRKEAKKFEQAMECLHSIEKAARSDEI